MKDYGISYMPELEQILLEPKEPIINNKLDENKINELIDKKLQGLQGIKGEKGETGETPSDEKLITLINESLRSFDFQVSSIQIVSNAPTYQSTAKVGEARLVLGERKQLFVCIKAEDTLSNWVDVLGDGSGDIISKHKVLISFDTTTETNAQYGGCMSDLRFAFENEFASAIEWTRALNECEFLLQKDGNGLSANNANEVSALSYPQANQIKARLSTEGIYADVNSHAIGQVLKLYDGDYTSCCLWAASGTRAVNVELESEKMPNQIFIRGHGYYGGVSISNLRVRKTSFIGDVELESEDYDISTLENSFGNKGFLFGVQKRNERSTKTTKKGKK
ncbi:hypothetical protein RLQ69_000440 [Campylobacter jejuni]|uniref:Uncharacterized protein n=1 Tax=Campylobacter jejuni TaxID=197 RepID=A0A690V6Z3_CAMJU|nr:hypothetical protein [Campylobacter jejuni]EAJ5193030.1 hypothetical protein [Campylobacter jejuni]EAK0572965.1 hypothetical protein [Campylobacter jejuni]EDP7702489.1 hypothetical protein [Campylobacter jejuni]EDP8233575.1 hypothetical protein [Campylobacter jejuni]EFV4333933.1 hypothetical protein [Campylobacter jejuni]